MSLKKLLTHPVILYTASENPLTPLIYLLKQVQEPNIVYQFLRYHSGFSLSRMISASDSLTA